MVEFSNILYFQTYFFENPTFHGRLDGSPCLVCFYWKSFLNMCMKWVVGNMRYTLDIIVVSIGIIGSFQLVSILTFLYTHILFLCMYAFNWYHLLWLVLIFYTPIYVLFVLKNITNFVYAKAWVLTLFQLIQFSIGFLNKLMHVFCWYFIKGEKIRFSYFNWYFVPLLYDRK